MKAWINSAVLLLGVGVFATHAQADQLVTSASFSGSFGQATGLNYFDSKLGTLNSVNVQIMGTLQGQFETQGQCDQNGCIPTLYDVEVNQTFTGLGGQFFSFATPAVFQFVGEGTFAQAFSLATFFSYSFTFNSTTDLAGQAFPNSTGPTIPPLFVSGMRNDFLEPVIPLKEVDVATSLALATGVLDVTGLGSDGAIIITYDYTRAVSAVPESSMFAPVLAGFLLVLLMKCAREGKRPAPSNVPSLLQSGNGVGCGSAFEHW